MAVAWLRRWEGGRVRVGPHGDVYVIEKMVAGKRYSVSLDVATEKQAVAALVRFEADPEAFVRPEARVGVSLDAETLEAFLAERAKRLSPEYVRDELRPYLRAWLDVLRGRALPSVSSAEWKRLLRTWPTATRKRVTVLKAFTSWLREEGMLEVRDDTTLGLVIPAPERSERRVYTVAEVEAVYAGVDEQVLRDMIRVAAKFGPHQRELRRIASGGPTVTLTEVGPWPGCTIVATVRYPHKSGDMHTVSLDAETFAALKRLRARGGTLSSSAAAHKLAAVAALKGVPHLHLGAMRHSFTTWCRTPGLVSVVRPPAVAWSLDDVAAITGHLSTKTTKRYYDKAIGVPIMASVPIRLLHPDDP